MPLLWFHCMLILLLLQFSAQVLAHTTGVSFADFKIGDKQVDLRLQINLREFRFAPQLDANGDRLITDEEVQTEFPRFAPLLLEQCRIWTPSEEGQGTLAGVNLQVERGELECRFVYSFRHRLDDLTMKMALHHLTDSGHWNLAQIQYNGTVEQRYFNLENPETKIALGQTWRSYLRLAGRFLTLSLDSLRNRPEMAGFLGGLVLVAKSWRGFLLPPLAFFFAQLAGFIAGTQYGLSLPARFVASALALSLMYVAAENLLLREISHRSLIAALFGVIYGCSFSAIGQEVGLPQKGLITALVSYELGIMMAGAAVVALVILATRYLFPVRSAIILGSWVCLAAGTIRFIQRTF